MSNNSDILTSVLLRMMLKNALEHYKTVIKIKGRLRTLDALEHLGTQGSQRSKE